MAFSPDGKEILTGSGDGTARVWYAATGQEVLALKGHTGAVTSVAFSPDGTRIVTGSEDKTAMVWETGQDVLGLRHTKAGQEVFALRGHTGAVTSVAFSPDGRRIVTGSEDKTARVWDADKDQEVRALRTQRQTTWVRSVAFSPDGKRIVTDEGLVLDAATGHEVLTLGYVGIIAGSRAFSPDGKRIVTRDGRVRDADTGQEKLTLVGHSNTLIIMGWSPDGKRIVTGSGDGTARVWDAATGQEVLKISLPNGALSMALSPDGKRIFTGSHHNTARVWDASTGRELLSFGLTPVVTIASFSPDGKRIVTGGYRPGSQGTVAVVWDADTGQELFVLKGHTIGVNGFASSGVNSVAFSPDGTRIVTGRNDGTARVWYADTGQEVIALKGHTNEVTSVAFSPDGKRIVTAGGLARVWDADKGPEVLTLKGHTNEVTSVAFSRDGKRVFAWDTQNKVLAWSAASGQPIDPVDPPAAALPRSRTLARRVHRRPFPKVTSFASPTSPTTTPGPCPTRPNGKATTPNRPPSPWPPRPFRFANRPPSPRRRGSSGSRWRSMSVGCCSTRPTMSTS